MTAERAASFGGEAKDSYAIRFADGPFAYELELFGPPGEVSEEQAEEIAERVHDRIEGAPPPNA